LLQQPVDQGSLAMVDVRDDGDVAKIHYGFQKLKPAGSRKDFRRKSVFHKRISERNPSFKRQQDCRMAILGPATRTLLRRNIVSKSRNATARLP
jgi:hypothetical protein